MRKHVVCEAEGRRTRIAWLSFQPDGSISFGLQDRTFISPALRIRQGIWNAYNRRRLGFAIASDPAPLLQINNPHFTYHPPGVFHLRANNHDAEEDIFRGVARVAVALDQQAEVPWIKAVSAPVFRLPAGGVHPDAIEVEDLVLHSPSSRDSAYISIDFVKSDCSYRSDKSQWCISWHDLAVKITLSFGLPQIPTMTWRHDS